MARTTSVLESEVDPLRADLDECGTHASMERSGSGRGGRRVTSVVRHPLVLPLFVLAFELAVLGLPHIGTFVGLSPVDELMHFDNLVRTSQPDLAPEPGAPLSQETLREVACRDEYRDAWRVAPHGAACTRTRHDAQGFWWHGLNPSIGHVPLYYVTTGLAARGLRMLVPRFGLLTWARLLGLVWAFAGCCLALRASQALAIDRWTVTAGLAMTLAVPSQLAAMTMVNPDAALFCVGSGMLFVLVQIEHGQWPRWSIVPAVIVALLIDLSSVVVVLMALGYLALRGLSDLRGHGRAAVRDLLTVAAIGIASVATFEGWSRIFRVLTAAADLSGSPQDRLYSTVALPISQLLGRSSILAMFPPVEQPNSPPPLRAERVAVFVAFAALLLVAGSLATVLRASPDRRMGRLAVCAVGALIVTPPLVIWWNYHSAGWYFSIPSRYGLSVLPALAIILAASATTRVGRAVLAAVTTGLVLSTVTAVLHVPV